MKTRAAAWKCEPVKKSTSQIGLQRTISFLPRVEPPPKKQVAGVFTQPRPKAVIRPANLNLHMMLYRLYCSSGNTVDLDEYMCYSEIGPDGLWTRYIEIRSDGMALRYDLENAADQYGVLPEGEWRDAEASLKEFGAVSTISPQLFDALWSVTRCMNEGNRRLKSPAF